MRATFIEGDGSRLAIRFEPEIDEERLLLKAFDQQIGGSKGVLRVNGWATDSGPALRSLRVEHVEADNIDAIAALKKRLKEVLDKLDKRDQHAEMLVSAITSDQDARRLCALITHDMYRASTTTTELALAAYVLDRIGNGWTSASAFRACDTCAAKGGSPALCDGCAHNRALMAQWERRLANTQNKS